MLSWPRLLRRAAFIFLFLLAAPSFSEAAETPSPPGQGVAGFGSSESYITDAYSAYEFGSEKLGTRTWFYIPDTLKHGTSAPVVVFLHGWTALVPELYLGALEHLLFQGYVVVYPQYQRGGAVGILTDLDQNRFLDRAVVGVEEALERLGDVAEDDALFVAGHSLGGLLAFCWNGASPHPSQGVLLWNASLESDDAIPDQVPIVSIDWRSYAWAVNVPTMILTGDADPLNPDSLLAFDAIYKTDDKIVYLAQSDDHGQPPVSADHEAALAGSQGADTLDYRYYFASLDAMLSHQLEVEFDMGEWSDGQPLAEVLTWAR